MAFGNATKGYVKAHSGGGGSGTTNYPDLTNLPKINGVTLTGNKTSSDLGIETGSDDYEDLTNLPSINGVELLGDKEVGLLSGNIHVDYTKLTNLPSINGVELSGNKTSADLNISGSGLTTTTLWTNDGSHSADDNGPFNLSANVTTFKAIKFIFNANGNFLDTTIPAIIVNDLLNNRTHCAGNQFIFGGSGKVTSWIARTACFAYLPSETTVSFKIGYDNESVKLKLWEVIGIN